MHKCRQGNNTCIIFYVSTIKYIVNVHNNDTYYLPDNFLIMIFKIDYNFVVN